MYWTLVDAVFLYEKFERLRSQLSFDEYLKELEPYHDLVDSGESYSPNKFETFETYIIIMITLYGEDYFEFTIDEKKIDSLYEYFTKELDLDDEDEYHRNRNRDD